MTQLFEAVLTLATGDSRDTAGEPVPIRYLGDSAVTAVAATDRLVITGASMQCDAAGEFHVYLGTVKGDEGTANLHVDVLHVRDSTAPIYTIPGVEYVALDPGDLIFCKTPTTTTVNVKIYGYVTS